MLIKMIDPHAMSIMAFWSVKNETNGYLNTNKTIPAESMNRELILKQILTCSFAILAEPLPIELATKAKRIVATPSAGMKVNCINLVRIVAAPKASSP